METEKRRALDFIGGREKEITAAADRIWEFAELSMEETRSAALYGELLEEAGFKVEKNLCGIPTALSGSFGSGRPCIGILGEYDALSGLSQKAGQRAPEPVQAGGSGHGCGHNLLGAGAFGAALGVKAYLESTGKPGTVFFFGCPGEEGVASKAFMARDGLWKKLDAALTWHPDDCNEAATGSSNACIQVRYTFLGVSAHAAGSPERGRSALDAAELMNVGAQFLREHMGERDRIHYAITDAGGKSPNVVQSRASVLYMVRSNKVKDALSLQKRVDKLAEGAALMTETAVERQFIDGLADTVPNHVLEKLLYENLKEAGIPAHTEEELRFAGDIQATYGGSPKLPGTGSAFDPDYKKQVEQLKEQHPGPMNDFLLPLYTGYAFEAGSTDVGDVSYLCPTAQLHVAAWPDGCPGHSWQNVSCGGASLGHKAAMQASKALCGCAIDLLNDNSLLEKARAEFLERTKEGYACPIPPEAVARPVE